MIQVLWLEIRRRWRLRLPAPGGRPPKRSSAAAAPAPVLVPVRALRAVGGGESSLPEGERQRGGRGPP